MDHSTHCYLSSNPNQNRSVAIVQNYKWWIFSNILIKIQDVLCLSQYFWMIFESDDFKVVHLVVYIVMIITCWLYHSVLHHYIKTGNSDQFLLDAVLKFVEFYQKHSSTFEHSWKKSVVLQWHYMSCAVIFIRIQFINH